MATLASPSFVYQCEMSLACTYALTQPTLALECAWTAYDAALRMGRPDLAFNANELMAVINGDAAPVVTVVEVR